MPAPTAPTYPARFRGWLVLLALLGILALAVGACYDVERVLVRVPPVHWRLPQ